MRTHAPVSSRRNRAVLIEGLETRTLMAAPIADTGFYATLPNTALNVAAPGVFKLAFDADGDAMQSAAVFVAPAHGSLDLQTATGAFTYTPETGYAGFDSFQYFVTAGGEGSNVAEAFIFVGSRGVTAGDDAYSVLQGQTLTVTAPGVLGNDSQADSFPITAVINSLPAHGGLTLDPTGAFSYIPTPNFSGVDFFTYHATDGAGNSNIATVTITVQSSQPPASNLLDMLKTLRSNGTLNNGQFISLSTKLDLMTGEKGSGKSAQAQKKLADFIKEVESLMKGKKPELTLAQGQALITAAQALFV